MYESTRSHKRTNAPAACVCRSVMSLSTIKHDFEILATHVSADYSMQRWSNDTAADDVIALHANASGTYVLRRHPGYGATGQDVFQFGSVDKLDGSFATCHEGQSIVAFYPTPCPRTAEAVIARVLKPCVVLGTNTVICPLNVIKCASLLGCNAVTAAIRTLGDPPTEMKPVYDKTLKELIEVALSVESNFRTKARIEASGVS